MALVPHILEVATPGRRVRLDRGRIVVADDTGVLGGLPIDDVTALILSTPAVTLSGQALASLAERGTPVVLVGADFAPIAHLTPLAGHHAQADRVAAQAAASLPTHKRLWAEVVRAKLLAQAAALDRVGAAAGPRLRVLAKTVRSGDAGNVEATGAQAYWPALFGPDFRRDRDGAGINAMINYGSAVLRAAAARAIVAAGLHPSLSLHHKSRGDPLRLADDLMEPFRPTVELEVHALRAEGATEVTPEVKRRLAGVLRADFDTEPGVSPLSTTLVRLAVSLAEVFLGKRTKLALPKSPIPLPANDVDPKSEEPW